MTEQRGAQRGLPVSRLQAFVIFLVVILAFVVLALRVESNTSEIERSQRQIAKTQWTQCTARNEATTRQNALLDSAIAAERRRPVPDQRRIRDITKFKGNILDCGVEPR